MNAVPLFATYGLGVIGAVCVGFITFMWAFEEETGVAFILAIALTVLAFFIFYGMANL